MHLTKDIQKKILEASLNTDSDIADLAEEIGISFYDILILTVGKCVNILKIYENVS